MRRSLQSLPGKVLWFLDTCHAGSAARRAPVDMNVLTNTVTSAENGGIVAFALESTDEGNHSAAVITALRAFQKS